MKDLGPVVAKDLEEKAGSDSTSKGDQGKRRARNLLKNDNVCFFIQPSKASGSGCPARNATNNHEFVFFGSHVRRKSLLELRSCTQASAMRSCSVNYDALPYVHRQVQEV